MAESPFAYYRGTPAVMAFDLSETPRTDIIVQASGDAHLSNFGIYASPERNIVFDSNDFDETLPAPWEWDVKRLAASVVIAGRSNGFSRSQNRDATMATVRVIPGVDGALRRHAVDRRLVLGHHRAGDSRRRRGDLGEAWKTTPRRGPSLRGCSPARAPRT